MPENNPAESLPFTLFFLQLVMGTTETLQAVALTVSRLHHCHTWGCSQEAYSNTALDVHKISQKNP
jgi:hypothetical protein